MLNMWKICATCEKHVCHVKNMCDMKKICAIHKNNICNMWKLCDIREKYVQYIVIHLKHEKKTGSINTPRKCVTFSPISLGDWWYFSLVSPRNSAISYSGNKTHWPPFLPCNASMARHFLHALEPFALLMGIIYCYH